MFARMLELEIKTEKQDEFVKFVKNEVLPILKKQIGFLEILPLVPEKTADKKLITISLWAGKADAERYEREAYGRVYDLLRPYLATPIKERNFLVESALCQHFVDALAA